MWSCWLYAEFSSCSVMKMIVIMMMVVQRFSQFINLLCSRWNSGFYGVAKKHSYEDHFHAYGSIMITRKIILNLYKLSLRARIILNSMYLYHTITILHFNIFFIKPGYELWLVLIFLHRAYNQKCNDFPKISTLASFCCKGCIV